MRVHIVGASGSGTTTLGRALAARRGSSHLDTDDYWLPSDPPFQHIRERGKRQALLSAALRASNDWVVSGSLCGWGDLFIPQFEMNEVKMHEPGDSSTASTNIFDALASATAATPVKRGIMVGSG
jgi:hypothetical protein